VPHSIGSRLDPVTEVTTSIGLIYLYRWGVSDLNAFKNLSRATPDDRIRTILQHVSSLNSCGLSRKPPKDEEFNLSTDADLENLAKNMLRVILFWRYNLIKLIKIALNLHGMRTNRLWHS